MFGSVFFSYITVMKRIKRYVLNVSVLIGLKNP